jgi:hypothetical protein
VASDGRGLLERVRKLTGGCQGEIETTLDAAACHDRLSAAVPEGWFLRSRHGVYGEVHRHGGALRKASFIQNTGQPVLHYSVEFTEAGTRISYRSGVPVGLLVFVAVWTGLLLIVSVPGFEALLDGVVGPALWAPLLMIAFGGLLFGVFRAVAVGDGVWLADFLARTVEGRIVR